MNRTETVSPTAAVLSTMFLRVSLINQNWKRHLTNASRVIIISDASVTWSAKINCTPVLWLQMILQHALCSSILRLCESFFVVHDLVHPKIRLSHRILGCLRIHLLRWSTRKSSISLAIVEWTLYSLESGLPHILDIDSPQAMYVSSSENN